METVNFGLNERRVDQDGQAYTFQEYLEFYGSQSGKTRWKTNSAEQPVDAIVGRPESRAEQHGNINSAAPPVDITASSVSSVVKPDGFVPTFVPQTAPPEQAPSSAPLSPRWELVHLPPPPPSPPVSSVAQPAVSVPPPPPPTAVPRARIRLESAKELQTRILHPLRAAVKGKFPHWILPLSLHVAGSDIALEDLHEVFDVVWKKVSGFQPAVLDSLHVRTWNLVFYSDEPDSTPPDWPDRPRLDVVITFTDERWVRWHSNANLIWSTEDMPTPAIKNRRNRHAKLLKALQQHQ